MLTKEQFVKIIGKGISKLRYHNGYSIKEVSDKLGIPYQTYKRWENGEVLPTLYNFFKLCEFYNVSPEKVTDIGENGFIANAISLKKVEKFLLNKPKTLEVLLKIIENLDDDKTLLKLLSGFLSIMEEIYRESK